MIFWNCYHNLLVCLVKLSRLFFLYLFGFLHTINMCRKKNTAKQLNYMADVIKVS